MAFPLLTAEGADIGASESLSHPGVAADGVATAWCGADRGQGGNRFANTVPTQGFQRRFRFCGKWLI
jgi:hypothetical protein